MGFLKTIQTIWGQQHVKVYMQMLIIAYFSWKKCLKKSWIICILMNMSTDCNTVILVQLDLNDFDLARIWKIPFSGVNSLSLCTKICKCALLLFLKFYFTTSLYILYFILLLLLSKFDTYSHWILMEIFILKQLISTAFDLYLLKGFFLKY